MPAQKITLSILRSDNGKGPSRTIELTQQQFASWRRHFDGWERAQRPNPAYNPDIDEDPETNPATLDVSAKRHILNCWEKQIAREYRTTKKRLDVEEFSETKDAELEAEIDALPVTDAGDDE